MKPDPTDDRSASPGITLLESRNHAIHGHRGRGAIIDDVVLHFEVKDGHEHHIVITHVDHMWRSCNSDDQAWQSREAHVVSKHVLYDWTTNTPIATATGERGVRIVPATP